MDKKDEICTSKAPNRLKSRRKTHLVAIVVRCYVFKLTDYFKYRYRDVFWWNLDLIAFKWKQKRCFVIKNAIKFIHGGARTEVPRVRLPKGQNTKRPSPKDQQRTRYANFPLSRPGGVRGAIESAAPGLSQEQGVWDSIHILQNSYNNFPNPKFFTLLCRFLRNPEGF